MPENTGQPATRRRNAAATRSAILSAAISLFARSGYDGVGVREIAGAAGVTAMLVNRYFGSKEGLFAAAVAETMANAVVLTPEIIGARDMPHALATALVTRTAPGSEPLAGFLIMLRSASNPRAAEIWRAQVSANHQQLLAGALVGEGASARAALMLSLVAGFQVMRQMIGLTALNEVAPDILVREFTRVLEVLAGDERATVAATP